MILAGLDISFTLGNHLLSGWGDDPGWSVFVVNSGASVGTDVIPLCEKRERLSAVLAVAIALGTWQVSTLSEYEISQHFGGSAVPDCGRTLDDGMGASAGELRTNK